MKSVYVTALLLSLFLSFSASASTIWPSTSIPSIQDSGPDSAVEIGVKFRADAAGIVSGIRFYKGTGNTGTHVGNLWSNTGTRLASATFTNETASGWQQVNFSTPVTIAANTVYVVSYHTNVGHYSDDQSYFANRGVDNPPLHALRDGSSGADGVFAYGSSSAFPRQGWRSSNYWVDVVYTAGAIAVSLNPTSAAIQVNGTQQFTATVVGSSNQSVTWTVDSGAISPTGLYTAPSTAGTYHVVATSVADTTKSASATVIVMPSSPSPVTIFYDNFDGTELNSNWTVINRHGEYAQSETECNIPQQVTVTNSTVTITTAAQNWVCGDFKPD
jgi:hypothetical protein